MKLANSAAFNTITLAQCS